MGWVVFFTRYGEVVLAGGFVDDLWFEPILVICL